MRVFNFLFVLILISSCGKAQSNEKIVGFLKSKNVDSVINNCTFPFDLSAGTMADDDAIVDQGVLRKKLVQLFRNNYFDPLLKGKKTIKGNSIYFESHTFNSKGEMESESTIMFNFKKSKEGKVKLYQIILAG